MNRFTSNNGHDFDQQVANATGEDLQTIMQLGFSPLGPVELEERETPLMVDWDLLDSTRFAA